MQFGVPKSTLHDHISGKVQLVQTYQVSCIARESQHPSATSHSHSCTYQNRLYLTHLPCNHANKIMWTAVPILG